MRKPGGRCGARCPDHGDDVVASGGGDGVIKPVELVVALGRLHPAPGELADTNHVDACLLHQVEIGVPARFRPLFGIPGRAEDEWRRFGGLGLAAEAGGSCRDQEGNQGSAGEGQTVREIQGASS